MNDAPAPSPNALPPEDEAQREALEALLRAEPLLEAPAGLVEAVREALTPEPRRAWWVGTVKAAAGIAAAFVAWVLATGALPTPAMAAPSPAFGEALERARAFLPAAPLRPLASAPAGTEGLPPLLLAGAGLLCLLLGLGLAHRLLSSSTSEGSPS